MSGRPRYRRVDVASVMDGGWMTAREVCDRMAPGCGKDEEGKVRELLTRLAHDGVVESGISSRHVRIRRVWRLRGEPIPPGAIVSKNSLESNDDGVGE